MKRIKFLLIMFCLVFFFGSSLLAGELMYEQARQYFNEGVKAQNSGDFATAISNYQKVLLILPESDEYHKFIFNNMGVIFLRMGNEAEAEKMFNASLSVDPNYKPSKINLGFIYEKRMSRLEAIDYWLKALDIDLEKLKPKELVIEDVK